MRGAGFVLVVSAVAGCGRLGFNDQAVPPDAGPRVTQQFYEVGGLQIPDGLHDEVLDADCQFGEVNGSIRCMPEGMLVVYSDDACTHEVAAKQQCSTDTRYVVRGDVASIGDPTIRVFHAGAARGVTPTYIHNGDPNGCTTWGMVETFEIGDEIATDTLAPGTTETVPGPRLDTVNYVSTEGVRQLSHFIDHQLGFDCDVRVAHTGWQCAPREVGYAAYSSTSACSDHVAIASTPPTAIQWENFETGCALTDFYYYSVAGPLTPSALYQGPSCTSVSPLPAGPFYVSGSLLPLQTLSEASDVVPGQRIALNRISGGGASFTFGVHDTQLDVDCYPGTMSDGSIRCVPSGAYTSQVYVDAGCTNLVTFAVYQDFPNCAQTSFKYAVAGQNNACTSALDVYEVGAPFTGVFWVKDQTSACVGPFQAGPNPRYWQLGRKLDSSELVEATLP